MRKIEFVWRELLFRSIEKKNPYFTTLELSRKFSLSTSVVAHALIPLRDLRMVTIQKQRSLVIDAEKLLFYWATRRNRRKDIVYETYSSSSVFTIEASMPSASMPAAYSAYRLYLGNPPADYDHVYYYVLDLTEVEKRFPPFSHKAPNIHMLLPDPFLFTYKMMPLAQMFVDLWNSPEWYAKEFSQELELHIKSRLGI